MPREGLLFDGPTNTSSDEIIVDPREAIASLPGWLSQQFPITFHWGKCVSYVSDQIAYIGNEEEHGSDLIFICNGAE